jgi:hypothetical protein
MSCISASGAIEFEPATTPNDRQEGADGSCDARVRRDRLVRTEVTDRPAYPRSRLQPRAVLYHTREKQAAASPRSRSTSSRRTSRRTRPIPLTPSIPNGPRPRS